MLQTQQEYSVLIDLTLNNKTRTYIDLTLNNKVARKASKFVQSIVDVGHKVKTLLVLIKEFAKCYGINDHKRGTLANVGYIYMVVFVLQVHKLLLIFLTYKGHKLADLLAEANAYKVIFNKASEESGNTNILQLLHTFFHQYNGDYDFEKHAISVIGGQVVKYVISF